MKLDRIVIGTDFSDGSEEAARWVARTLARGAEIVLAHVITFPEPPPIVSSRYPRHELLLGTLREGADKRMRDLSQSIPADRIWLELREGDSAEGLAAIATEYSADLLVVGAHGERAGRAEGMGSTAQHVVRGSAIPVLLVTRPGEAPVSRILVPVDDDEVARDALRWAAALSERTGATVTTVHVTSAGVMTHALAAAAILSGTPPPTVAQAPGAPASSDRWVELAVASGVAPGRVTSEEMFGDPATEIVAAAEREAADLIIMGRRARGGLRRAVLGSVTEQVLRHAPCNVMVVPEP